MAATSAHVKFGAVVLAGAVAFLAYTLLRGAGNDARDPERFPIWVTEQGGGPLPGPMPPDLETDTSAEAVAFKETCRQCHPLPSPFAYHKAGWRATIEKMKAHMVERGLEVPGPTVDLCLAYLIDHAPEVRPSAATLPTWRPTATSPTSATSPPSR